MPDQQESDEHKLWSEELRDVTLYSQRFDACLAHLAFNAPTLSMKEAADRAADYAGAMAAADRRQEAALRNIGPEPPWNDEVVEAPPTAKPEAPAPLRANPNPAMNFGAWGKHDQRPY